MKYLKSWKTDWANSVLEHILQVESAQMIILNYFQNSDLIMTKQMSLM